MGVQSSLLLWTLVVEPHGLPSPGVGTLASSFLYLLLVPACIGFCLEEYLLLISGDKKGQSLPFATPSEPSSPRPTPFPSHSSQSFILSRFWLLCTQNTTELLARAMETSRFPLCDIGQVGAG